MKTTLSAAALLLLILHGPFTSALAASEGLHVLVLPFRDMGETAPDPGYGRAAADMMEVCLSQAEGIFPVYRRGLEALLAEHHLSLTGLTGEKERLQAVALAGAQAMIIGSILHDEEGIRVDGRAFDAETGLLLATHAIRGERGFLAEAVHDLCSSLANALLIKGRRSFEGPADDNPVATLHFMRGLGLYHAARYEAAIGEFFHAGAEGFPAAPSRLWAARAYLALDQFADACLELQALQRDDLADGLRREVDGRLDLCRGKMNDEEAALVRGLLSGK